MCTVGRFYHMNGHYNFSYHVARGSDPSWFILFLWWFCTCKLHSIHLAMWPRA